MMSRMQTKTAGRRARRRFTSEFKAGAARLVLDENKTVGAVARMAGIGAMAGGLTYSIGRLFDVNLG